MLIHNLDLTSSKLDALTDILEMDPTAINDGCFGIKSVLQASLVMLDRRSGDYPFLVRVLENLAVRDRQAMTDFFQALVAHSVQRLERWPLLNCLTTHEWVDDAIEVVESIVESDPFMQLTGSITTANRYRQWVTSLYFNERGLSGKAFQPMFDRYWSQRVEHYADKDPRRAFETVVASQHHICESETSAVGGTASFQTFQELVRRVWDGHIRSGINLTDWSIPSQAPYGVLRGKNKDPRVEYRFFSWPEGGLGEDLRRKLMHHCWCTRIEYRKLPERLTSFWNGQGDYGYFRLEESEDSRRFRLMGAYWRFAEVEHRLREFRLQNGIS